MLQRTVPSVTPDSTGVEIAAAVLEDLKDPARWCIGQLENSRGQRCLMGSALHVCGFPANHSSIFIGGREVMTKLAGVLGFEPTLSGASEAALWNNRSTHEQVIQRLRDAVGVE